MRVRALRIPTQLTWQAPALFSLLGFAIHSAWCPGREPGSPPDSHVAPLGLAASCVSDSLGLCCSQVAQGVSEASESTLTLSRSTRAASPPPRAEEGDTQTPQAPSA